MDWPMKSPVFEEHDLNNVFQYAPGPSRVVRRLAKDDKIKEWDIVSEEQWANWFQSDLSPLCANEPGLGVILAGRADEGNQHDGSILQQLPFTRKRFSYIAATLPLHGDISRVINRCDVPFFGAIEEVDVESEVIFYCCRTTSTWPGDLAIASVFDVKNGFTSAVVFGCDEETTEAITARIESSEDACTHPLLIIGIIVEMERRRHMRLVQERVFELLQRVLAISRSERISETSELHKETYSVDLWVMVSQLRSAMETWRAQLLKLEQHIFELEAGVLGPDYHHAEADTRGGNCPRSPKKDEGDDPDSSLAWPARFERADTIAEQDEEPPWKPVARQTGRRMQKRLREIMCDYDEMIRECTMVIDGMALSTQLSWNQIGYQDTQTNLQIATDTRQDSSQMRSIAFLTMIFLPATFVASLFSMTFFNWNPSNGEQMLSPYAWLYPVITVGITAVVLLTWFLWMRKRKKEDKSPA